MGKPSVKNDLNTGKILINKNGHINNFSDYEYEDLIYRGYAESGECYLCGKRILHQFVDRYSSDSPRKIERLAWRYNRSDKETSNKPCSMSSKEKQQGAYDIDFKTGNVIIGNFFINKDKNAVFDIPKESKYLPKYNICNIQGQNNTADYFSKKLENHQI